MRGLVEATGAGLRGDSDRALLEQMGGVRAPRTARVVAAANLSDSNHTQRRRPKAEPTVTVVEATAIDDTAEEWQETGHRWLGMRVRRFFDKSYSDGRLTKWMPESGDDAAIWHMVHDDGDEEDLEEYEVVAAIRALLLGRTVGKNPEDASEVSDGEEDTARQGSQSETTEARLARTNQCAKNVSCVRGYKHGSGPCKIRDRVQATEEAEDEVEDGVEDAVEEAPVTSRCAKHASCVRAFRHSGRCKLR